MKYAKATLAFVVLTIIAGCFEHTINTPNPTLDVLPATTMQAESSYLEDCRKTYSKMFDQQIGYENIYPGKSTKQEVEQMVGSPERIIPIDENQEEYIYHDANLGIFFEQGTVSWIVVFDALKKLNTLEFYLNNYGCPDIIFIVDGGQHPTGNYNTLLLVYHKAGMTLKFKSFPIQITDSPFGINFYLPGSLADFLGENSFLNDPDIAKSSYWTDVITK